MVFSPVHRICLNHDKYPIFHCLDIWFHLLLDGSPGLTSSVLVRSLDQTWPHSLPCGFQFWWILKTHLRRPCMSVLCNTVVSLPSSFIRPGRECVRTTFPASPLAFPLKHSKKNKCLAAPILLFTLPLFHYLWAIPSIITRSIGCIMRRKFYYLYTINVFINN